MSPASPSETSAVDLQLLTLIDVFRRTPSALTVTGHPSRRALRLASAQVAGEEAVVPETWEAGGRLPLLYHVSRALGLLRSDGEHLRVDGERASEYFLAAPPDRVRHRVRAFRRVDTWTSLSGLEGFAVDLGPRGRAQGAPDLQCAVRARGHVLDAVARLAVGRSTRVDALGADVGALWPTLLFPVSTGPYYPGVTRRPGLPSLVARGDGWGPVEVAFVRAVLGILGDLGVVTLGPDSFEVTAAGLYALDTGPRPDAPQPAGGELVVQPTFEVVVLAPEPDVALLFTLERFAERTGPAPGSTYRMDEASVYRAVREGLEMEDIQAFLRAHARQPLPESVAFSLQDWARRQERIQVWRRSALIEFPDAGARADALITMDLAGAEARQVGDRWVLVPDGDRRRVTRCLGQNYFADLDYLEDLPPCVTADAEGVLRVAPDTARLDVDRRLGEFAEAAEAGGWRITPASLERAQAAGRPASRILETLDELVAGGVPPALRVLIDASTGHLGRVAVGPVTALVAQRAGDAERVAELPEVAPWVLRVLPGGVVILRAEHEQRVRAALSSLGVVEDPALLLRVGVAPAATPVVPATEPAAVGVMDAAEVRRLLARAVADDREAVIRYDPGARMPLQDLRVAPLRIETKNGLGYLHARTPGRQAPRKFGMRFVQGVRLLGPE